MKLIMGIEIMNYFTYHDLKKENKHGFTAGDKPLTEKSLVVREMVVPGMAGYPDMHIRHIDIIFEEQKYLLITMTDYELDQAKILEISIGAAKFLKTRSQRN